MEMEGGDLLCICQMQHKVRACQLHMPRWTRITSAASEGYLLKGGWKNEVLCLGKAMRNSFLYSIISKGMSRKTRNKLWPGLVD